MSNKGLTQKDLLREIKNLAERKGRDYVTRREFVDETGISVRQILKYFDKWNNAVKEAGLRPLNNLYRPYASEGYSEKELLEMIRRVSSKLGKESLSLTEFCDGAGISYRPIHRVFGDWNTALQRAGLRRHPAHKLKIPNEELFEEYFRVTEELTRFPSYSEFARRSSKYSIGVYEHRFGNFTEFRKRAIQYGIDKGLVKPEIAQPAIENLPPKATYKEPSYKAFEGRPVLGERIDFRSLLHAPVNELGVVYLFGILSDDLGFIVESVQAGFPDCEAKRKLRNNKWQNVRIEFEYRSSNFLEHRHDMTKCDIIICWEHDWNNCPLEVISLKEHLETIHGLKQGVREGRSPS